MAPVDAFPTILARVFGISRVRLRRRGPGEDSTARAPVARRFWDTPRGYPNVGRTVSPGARTRERTPGSVVDGPANGPSTNGIPRIEPTRARTASFNAGSW